MQTNLGNSFPPKREYQQSQVAIAPKNAGWFDDFGIPVPSMKTGDSLEGEMKFRLKYGRKNNLRHELSMHKKVLVARSADGSFRLDSQDL